MKTNIKALEKTYNYEEAVNYLINKGIGCDPCQDVEGEYVCDLLDEMIDGWEENDDEEFYYEGTLDSIIELAKEYIQDQKEDN